MEFWGVEVKAGQAFKVQPEYGRVIHISQAALGEGKKEKGNDLIPLSVKISGEKYVLGSLSAEKFPQISFDLVFERDFELSHDWKNGSVYFCGYMADNPFPEEEVTDYEDTEDDSDSEEEEIPLGVTENGNVGNKVKEPKAAASKGKAAAKPESAAKPKVTVPQPKKDDEDEEEDESDEDESDDDEDMMDASDDDLDSDDEDDSEEDESEDEDEETPTPKKAPSKKRPTDSATKTPVSAKKAKLETPQKTDGKKEGGKKIATPHPAKKGGQTPASGNKSKEQTPKSEGKVSCKSCSKTFNSETALQSHSKAKHGGN